MGNVFLIPTDSPTKGPTRSPTASPTILTPSPTLSPWMIGPAEITRNSNGFFDINIAMDIGDGPSGIESQLYYFGCKELVYDPNSMVSLVNEIYDDAANKFSYDLVVDLEKFYTSNMTAFDPTVGNGQSFGNISYCTKTTTLTANGMQITSKRTNFAFTFDLSISFKQDKGSPLYWETQDLN